MANPWDKDPIVKPVQQPQAGVSNAEWWANDPIVGAPQNPPTAATGTTDTDMARLIKGEPPKGTFSDRFQSNLNSSASGFADGIPLVGPYFNEGLNKAEAGIRSVFSGDSYQNELAGVHEREKADIAANPGTHTLGEIGGAIEGSAPLMVAAPAAFGMGAGSLPVRMVAGGLTGGGIGAADSAIRSGGDLGKTAIGGTAGLIFGAGAPALGTIGGGIYRGLTGNAARNTAAQMAGTSKPAVDVVARALGADNALGPTSANIAAAGPRAMLADAGPSTLSVLDTAIQRGGPGAGEAAQRIGARAAGATGDINAALDSSFGPAEGMVAPLEALRTSTQPARSAAYEAAYAQPIDYGSKNGQALENIIRTRVPQSAINRANELMRINGEQSKQILARVADDGSVTYERLPDVRQIDYITRGLRDVAAEADGKGKLGGTTDLGLAYGNLSKTIRALTTGLVPEYRTALNTAAQPIAQREATLFGQSLLSPSISRDEVRAFVSGLSDAELKSLRGGIRSKISETLANTRRTLTDPNVDARQGAFAIRDLSSDAVREKLADVLGKGESQLLTKAIDQAAKSFDLRAGVSANSRTYARQAAERAVDQATAPGFIETAASGKPLETARGVMQRVFGVGDEAQLARKDAAWSDIANLLTQPANQANAAFVQAMQGAANRLPIIDQNAAAIARGITGAAAVSASPTRRLLTPSR